MGDQYPSCDRQCMVCVWVGWGGLPWPAALAFLLLLHHLLLPLVRLSICLLSLTILGIVWPLVFFVFRVTVFVSAVFGRALGVCTTL